MPCMSQEFAWNGPHIDIKLVVAKHLASLICHQKSVNGCLYCGLQYGEGTIQFRLLFHAFSLLLSMLYLSFPLPNRTIARCSWLYPLAELLIRKNQVRD